MKQKLLDLLAQKKTIVDNMKAADKTGDQTAFDTAQASLAPVNAEIARVQAIIEEEESLPPPSHEGDHGAGAGGGAPGAVNNRGGVNSNECIHAFAQCIRAKARGDRQMFDTNAAVVHRAVRNEGGMNETTPSAGGLIVPQDIQTEINTLRRALSPLSSLFSVETVSSLSGSRVLDTHPTAGFTKTAEASTIPRDDKPAFSKIDYKVEDYALIVPVSNDLMEDTDQALLSYLAGWFAKKGVITENKLLLTLLATLNDNAVSAAAGKELATLKKALNVALDPAIALTSSFITNQDGFNYLDTLEDKNGRPLLQPNPSDPTRMMLGARPISVRENSVLPSVGGKAPLYVGDFKQYGTLFRRKELTVDATNVGGKSWDENTTEVRGIMRLDAKTFDTAAATAVSLTLPV